MFVGGQKKKAVSETWRGLETGWGEGVVLGGGSLRACEGIALPGRKRPSKNGMT